MGRIGSINTHLGPHGGEWGRVEDLGPATQPRDPGVSVSMFEDHCGGLTFGGDGHLYYVASRWRDPDAERLGRRAVDLPESGAWEGADLRWARDPRDGVLIAADAEGQLFAWDGRQWGEPLAKTLVAPVNCMAITFDGRLFGHCGDGIGRLFGYDPDAGEMTDTGVAASVFNRRRYGYVFGDAVIGRDGEIVFGEDDDLGHVWLYFPRIRGR